MYVRMLLSVCVAWVECISEIKEESKSLVEMVKREHLNQVCTRVVVCSCCHKVLEQSDCFYFVLFFCITW